MVLQSVCFKTNIFEEYSLTSLLSKPKISHFVIVWYFHMIKFFHSQQTYGWCYVLLEVSHLEIHDFCLSLVGDTSFDHLIKGLPDFSTIYCFLFLFATNKQSVSRHFKSSLPYMEISFRFHIHGWFLPDLIFTLMIRRRLLHGEYQAVSKSLVLDGMWPIASNSFERGKFPFALLCCA